MALINSERCSSISYVSNLRSLDRRYMQMFEKRKNPFMRFGEYG